jgi:hypothetical protein
MLVDLSGDEVFVYLSEGICGVVKLSDIGLEEEL